MWDARPFRIAEDEPQDSRLDRPWNDTLDKIRNWVEYDLYYIDNWSIWLDILTIAKTVMVLFRDEKAY